MPISMRVRHALRDPAAEAEGGASVSMPMPAFAREGDRSLQKPRQDLAQAIETAAAVAAGNFAARARG